MIKLIFFVPLLAFVSAQVGDLNPGCVNNTNPHMPILLPHDSDCSKFLMCIGNYAVVVNCPPGQHWRVERNWCDWPEIANCEIASGNQCPPENSNVPVFFPHETDCTRFYICNWGVAQERECPPGQHWRVEMNWCDWPDFAQCQVSTTTDSSNTNNTTTGPETTVITTTPITFSTTTPGSNVTTTASSETTTTSGSCGTRIIANCNANHWALCGTDPCCQGNGLNLVQINGMCCCHR